MPKVVNFCFVAIILLSPPWFSFLNNPEKSPLVSLRNPLGGICYFLLGISGKYFVQFTLNSVYTRSGQNSTPNSNATNLHSSQKRCCSFCISSSNASPTFQVQKSIFHQMTKPIQVTVILPLLLAISFSRNDDIHSSISGISNDLIGVIPTIGQ